MCHPWWMHQTGHTQEKQINCSNRLSSICLHSDQLTAPVSWLQPFYHLSCCCTGHYAHVHGLFTTAAAHFAAAATGDAFNGDCGGGTLAALNQALAVLCEGGPGALVRATEILKKHSLYDSVCSGLPANERSDCSARPSPLLADNHLSFTCTVPEAVFCCCACPEECYVAH